MGADADLETFGRSHRQAEKIIEESGIPYTFLRPNGFMQNFLNYYGQSIKTQSAFYLPAGDGKLGLVDVRDIAAVAVEVSLTKGNGSEQQNENKSCDITGPEALPYSQAAETLSKEIGNKISYVDIVLELETQLIAIKKDGPHVIVRRTTPCRSNLSEWT